MRFRLVQAVLVLSLGFATWWIVFAITSIPFCWNSEDACIPAFQLILAIPIAVWAATHYARWFRRLWESRSDPDISFSHPAARTLLWVILGAWLGFSSAWLSLLVLAAASAVLGWHIDEESVSSLILTLVLIAGTVIGAVWMARSRTGAHL